MVMLRVGVGSVFAGPVSYHFIYTHPLKRNSRARTLADGRVWQCEVHFATAYVSVTTASGCQIRAHAALAHDRVAMKCNWQIANQNRTSSPRLRPCIQKTSPSNRCAGWKGPAGATPPKGNSVGLT